MGIHSGIKRNLFGLSKELLMKKVVVCSGIPGSGKSSLAKRIADEESGKIVSADLFFEKSGQYIYNASLIGDAHAECMRNFVNLVVVGYPLIIIDNTNIEIQHIQPYYSVARAFHYEVCIKTFIIDAETSFKRNLHAVPLKTCRNMEERLQNRKFPKFWQIQQEVFDGMMDPIKKIGV